MIGALQLAALSSVRLPRAGPLLPLAMATPTCPRQHLRYEGRMDPSVSALERAFQLARAGRVAGLEDIKAQLKREGYDDKVVDGGPSLRLQLSGLIRTARSSFYGHRTR